MQLRLDKLIAFFWDVKITQEVKDSPLQFLKATLSGELANFDSFVFESNKTGLTFTLLFSCFTICSDPQSFHLEADQLRQIFKCNNYPFPLKGQCVKIFLNNIFVPKKTFMTKKDLLIVLSFLTSCLSTPAEYTPESSPVKICSIKSLSGEKRLDFLPSRQYCITYFNPGKIPHYW